VTPVSASARERILWAGLMWLPAAPWLIAALLVRLIGRFAP
jgi:hypothetical protein